LQILRDIEADTFEAPPAAQTRHAAGWQASAPTGRGVFWCRRCEVNEILKLLRVTSCRAYEIGLRASRTSAAG
jgi:hypothetical protein